MWRFGSTRARAGRSRCGRATDATASPSGVVLTRRSQPGRGRMCKPWAVPTDEQIEAQIDQLEAEQERLRRREGATDPTLEGDAARLGEIRVELDRLWDFLRQRRALREAGDDPDLASERSADIVEKYWQ